jgi:hypothetical protein
MYLLIMHPFPALVGYVETYSIHILKAHTLSFCPYVADRVVGSYGHSCQATVRDLRFSQNCNLDLCLQKCSIDNVAHIR